MFEYIQGEKFKYFKNDKIFYCNTNKLLNNSIPYDANILVTHNADTAASEVLDKVSPWLEYNDKHWFTTNLDFQRKNVYPLPIGIENNLWQLRDNKIDKICKIATKETKKSLLCNAIFNIKTHPSRKETMKIFQNKGWCFTRISRNGEWFEEYLRILHQSKFTVCPRGNGIDTHRIWEVLYSGGIAIVESNILNNTLYKYLPNILIVEDFNIINQNYLEYMWKNRYEYFQIGKSWHKLNMQYWRDLINNAI